MLWELRPRVVNYRVLRSHITLEELEAKLVKVRPNEASVEIPACLPRSLQVV